MPSGRRLAGEDQDDPSDIVPAEADEDAATFGFALTGYPTAGAILGGLEVGALVAAFMYGTRRQ